MKSYTDLEQSKKLIEILPLESADMCFNISVRKNMPPLMIPYSRFDEFFSISPTPDFLIPCWSLAALLDVLPNSIYDNTDEYSQLEFSKISVAYHNINDGIKVGSIKDNLVDACVEMIIRLHELNLL